MSVIHQKEKGKTETHPSKYHRYLLIKKLQKRKYEGTQSYITLQLLTENTSVKSLGSLAAADDDDLCD